MIRGIAYLDLTLVIIWLLWQAFNPVSILRLSIFGGLAVGVVMGGVILVDRWT